MSCNIVDEKEASLWHFPCEACRRDAFVIEFNYKN